MKFVLTAFINTNICHNRCCFFTELIVIAFTKTFNVVAFVIRNLLWPHLYEICCGCVSEGIQHAYPGYAEKTVYPKT